MFISLHSACSMVSGERQGTERRGRGRRRDRDRHRKGRARDRETGERETETQRERAAERETRRGEIGRDMGRHPVQGRSDGWVRDGNYRGQR